MYGNDVPTISSVSHSSRASCDGAVPSSPIPPVVYGLSSGTQPLPEQRLDDWRTEQFGGLFELVGRVERTLAGQDDRSFRRHRGSRPPDASPSDPGSARCARATSEVWCGLLRFERSSLLHLLDIGGNRDVGDAPVAQGSPDRQVDDY